MDPWQRNDMMRRRQGWRGRQGVAPEPEAFPEETEEERRRRNQASMDERLRREEAQRRNAGRGGPPKRVGGGKMTPMVTGTSAPRPVAGPPGTGRPGLKQPPRAGLQGPPMRPQSPEALKFAQEKSGNPELGKRGLVMTDYDLQEMLMEERGPTPGRPGSPKQGAAVLAADAAASAMAGVPPPKRPTQDEAIRARVAAYGGGDPETAMQEAQELLEQLTGGDLEAEVPYERSRKRLEGMQARAGAAGAGDREFRGMESLIPSEDVVRQAIERQWAASGKGPAPAKMTEQERIGVDVGKAELDDLRRNMGALDARIGEAIAKAGEAQRNQDDAAARSWQAEARRLQQEKQTAAARYEEMRGRLVQGGGSAGAEIPGAPGPGAPQAMASMAAGAAGRAMGGGVALSEDQALAGLGLGAEPEPVAPSAPVQVAAAPVAMPAPARTSADAARTAPSIAERARPVADAVWASPVGEMLRRIGRGARDFATNPDPLALPKLGAGDAAPAAAAGPQKPGRLDRLDQWVGDRLKAGGAGVGDSIRTQLPAELQGTFDDLVATGIDPWEAARMLQEIAMGGAVG